MRKGDICLVDPSTQSISEALRKELGEKIINEYNMSPTRPTFTIQKDVLTQAIKFLVERFDARFLTITAYDNGIDFELIYHMGIKGIVANIKTIVPKEESQVASVTNTVPGALSAEREICDLFQIKFEGITDPRALIAPYEWRDVQAPLRKPMAGLVASYQKPTVEKLMQQGMVFPISSMVNNQRAALKLPPIVTTITKPEALKEIHEIASEVGFDKRIGYALDKNKFRY